MTVKELQKELAAALNGVEELVQRGCKAFAEDTRDIYKEADKWVSAGKTAIVVVTPERRRNGGAPGAPVAEAMVQIQCSERPALARTRQDSITALDAGEAVMLALDGRRGRPGVQDGLRRLFRGLCARLARRQKRICRLGAVLDVELDERLAVLDFVLVFVGEPLRLRAERGGFRVGRFLCRACTAAATSSGVASAPRPSSFFISSISGFSLFSPTLSTPDSPLLRTQATGRFGRFVSATDERPMIWPSCATSRQNKKILATGCHMVYNRVRKCQKKRIDPLESRQGRKARFCWGGSTILSTRKTALRFRRNGGRYWANQNTCS